MNEKQTAALREAFEELRKARAGNLNLMRNGDYYENFETQVAWTGWLDCAGHFAEVRHDALEDAATKCDQWAHHLSQFDMHKAEVADVCADMIRDLKENAAREQEKKTCS